MIFGSHRLPNTVPASMVGFITAYNNSGTVLWAQNFGSNNETHGMCLATDLSNNVYVTGRFSCDSIIFGNDKLYKYPSPMGSGLSDIFLAKYTPTGQALWARSMGGELSHDRRAIKG